MRSRWYTVLRLIIKPIAWLLFWVKVEGKENIDLSRRYLICPNHISNLDPVLLVLKMPGKMQIHYMAKAELFRSKLGNWFFRKVGAFPVNRGKGDLTAVETAIDVLKNGGYLGIFIEGTRSFDGKPLPPKAGGALIASKTRSGVLPVGISTKGGKVRPFKPITIRIGQYIPYEELGMSDKPGASQIKGATHKMMDAIVGLLDPM